MDAYFADPNGWVLAKLDERKGGRKTDFATQNTEPEDLYLTAAWVVVLASVVTYAAQTHLYGL